MGRNRLDYQEKKRAKNVSINNKILDEAEKLNLNLSAILEDSLFYYIYKASDEEREKYSKKKSWKSFVFFIIYLCAQK